MALIPVTLPYTSHGQRGNCQADNDSTPLLNTGIKLEFLPTYSPDLNPIEKSFSKIKAVLQRDRDRCKPLVDNIKTATMSVTKEDVAGWFRGCSYVLNENGLMELGLPEEEAS